MLNIKVKEKKDYYSISIKGKNYDIIEYMALLDGVIENIKKDYDLGIQEILYMLLDFKENTKETK